MARAGHRLIEDQLAEQFRVSRTPIRDAIQRLQQEGYVVTPDGFRHARPVVAPLVDSDADELCSLVALHEGHAAAAAARLPTERRLELVAELVSLNEGMRREGRGGESVARSAARHRRRVSSRVSRTRRQARACSRCST